MGFRDDRQIVGFLMLHGRTLPLGFGSTGHVRGRVAHDVISPAITACTPKSGYGLPHPPVGPRQSEKG